MPTPRMPHRPTRVLLSASALCVALVAQGQDPGAAPREWIGGAPFSQWRRATGDWAGLRSELEASGVEVGGGLTLDWAAPWHGGLTHRDSVSTLLDVNVACDLEQLAGVPGTIFYVDAYRIHGRDPSGDVGDLQGVSNIQAGDRAEIAEVWIETKVGEPWRFKVGKVDFNSEFAFNELGGDFVHSTAAISPTIAGYPTYPDPAMSVNAFYKPNDRCYVGAGVYDGATAEGIATGTRGPGGFFGTDDSDAYFGAIEAGYAWPGGGDWGSGRFAVGAWCHTGHFDTFDGGRRHGAHGYWLTFEQHVWRENPTVDGDKQGLGLFVSLGSGDPDVSVFADSAAVGVAWVGPLPSRDDDVLGFAVLHAGLSDEPGASTPNDETALELLYKIQLTPSVSLKPDLQYVIDAGGGHDNALVGLLRVEIQF